MVVFLMAVPLVPVVSCLWPYRWYINAISSAPCQLPSLTVLESIRHPDPCRTNGAPRGDRGRGLHRSVPKSSPFRYRIISNFGRHLTCLVLSSTSDYVLHMVRD